MAYGDPTRHWVNNEAAYRRLIDELSEFGARLLSRGYRLRLFSSDIWFDSKAIDDLWAGISSKHPANPGACLVRDPVRKIDDLLSQLAQVDCYVTCRFHGIVFAHLMNVPVLAIAPHPKVKTLMTDSGMSGYCLDISECTADRLIRRFDRLVTERSEIKSRIADQVARHQQTLSAQFDGLFQAEPDTCR